MKIINLHVIWFNNNRYAGLCNKYLVGSAVADWLDCCGVETGLRTPPTIHLAFRWTHRGFRYCINSFSAEIKALSGDRAHLAAPWIKRKHWKRTRVCTCRNPGYDWSFTSRDRTAQVSIDDLGSKKNFDLERISCDACVSNSRNWCARQTLMMLLTATIRNAPWRRLAHE